MKKLSIIILAVALMSSCQKEATSPSSTTNSGTNKTPTNLSGAPGNASGLTLQLDGNYVGNFSLATTTGTQVSGIPVALIVSGAQFSSGDPTKFYSLGGGTVAANNSALSFTDDEAFPNYLISGTTYPLSSVGLSNDYSYNFKGDSLLLTKVSNGITYSYKLKKQ